MLDTDPNDRPPPVHERPTWLTYAQAGEHLGLSPEAVRHRARRSGWRTQPGNDGRTLVLIPDAEVIDVRPRPTVHTAVQAPVRTPDHQDEIARANARAERAEARADEAMQRADAADADRRSAIALADQTVSLLTDAVARADRAEAAVAAERGRAEALRDRLDGMQEQLAAEVEAADQARRQEQAAQDNAEILREAEAARKGRGRLARLRAAWRGE